MREIINLPKLEKRDPDSHKGDFGRVFVIAGSTGLTGAAYLCSKSVLRSGTGLVTLGIPATLNAIMEVKLTCVMTYPLPDTGSGNFAKSAKEDILKFAKGFDVVVIGPGMSQSCETQELICDLLRELELPIVIDADGLNAICNKTDILNEAKNDVVITPHPGEFSRLMNIQSTSEVQNDRLSSAKNFIKKVCCEGFNISENREKDLVLVLKGNKTIVINDEKYYVNTTGNPGMASGGSGDVLSGIIAALIGQGYPAYDAAQLGVYIHGLAGDNAARHLGETSLIATDIIDFLPKTFDSLIDV